MRLGNSNNYEKEKSEFVGNVKYPSICQLGNSTSFLLTGGCSTITNEPTNDWFRIDFPETYNSKISSE